MIKNILKATAALAVAGGVALSPASAVDISFGQSTTATGITATSSGGVVSTTSDDTQTVLSSIDVPVTITSFDGLSTPISGYLNLSASSVSSAVQSALNVVQMFKGSFSITAKTLGSANNTDYITVNFDGAWTFSNMGSSSSGGINGSVPNQVVTFTSDEFSGTDLTAQAFNLSFSGVTPALSICGTTLCSFTGKNFAGSISATDVPEPATWAMMVAGFGMLGASMRRRKPTLAVNFG